MILDQRETGKEGTVTLEIRASGHGLVPAIGELIKLPIEGFEVSSTDDRELQVDELDARTDDGAPISTHEWRLVLEPKSENLPENFTFPEVLANLSTREDEGLTLQKYEDVDLVAVEQTTPIQGGSSKSPPYLLLLTPLLLVICISTYFLFFKKREEIAIQNGPELPATLTPVSLLAFLEDLHRDTQLSKEARAKIQKSIKSLEDRSFGPESDIPTIDELREIAEGLINPLQQAG
jgi:hypothetical protein